MEEITVCHIDLGNLSSESYNNVMDEISVLFENRAEHTFRDVPVTNNDEGWHIISLDMPQSFSVQILVDQATVYLSAVRDGHGQWFHFWDAHVPAAMFNGQVIRHLTSSYFSLVRDWEEVSLGPQSLSDSYFRLVNFNNHIERGSPIFDGQRRALARLAVTFCEGARLRSVKELVSQQMDQFVNTTIGDITQKRIKSWDLMSRFALHCWRREYDGVGGYLESEYDKLHQCRFRNADEVVGDHGELLLIRYRKDPFDNLLAVCALSNSQRYL